MHSPTDSIVFLSKVGCGRRTYFYARCSKCSAEDDVDEERMRIAREMSEADAKLEDEAAKHDVEFRCINIRKIAVNRI